MMEFMAQNTGNIAIGLMVLALIAVAVRTVRKARKGGGCGCGCEGCSSRGICHPDHKQ